MAAAGSVPVFKLFKLPEEIQGSIVEFLPDPSQFWKTCKTARILGMTLIPNCVANPRILRFVPSRYISSIDFYHRTVAALTYRARQLGMEVSPPGIDLGKFVEQISAKEQALKDHALVKIFGKIQFIEAIPGPLLQPDVTEAVNAATIRAWLALEGNEAFIRNLDGLDLSGLGLKVLPDEFEFFTGLTTLAIVGNYINELTPAVRKLRWFQVQNEFALVIIIGSLFRQGTMPPGTPDPLNDEMSVDEKIAMIRAWIAVSANREILSQIRKIEISREPFILLPPEIGLFTNLEDLSLADCLLMELPPEIRHLKPLRSLLLRGNNLVSLPREIGELCALEKLFVSDNRLRILPPDLVNLTALRTIAATNNQFVSHPGCLGRHVEEMKINFDDRITFGA